LLIFAEDNDAIAMSPLVFNVASIGTGCPVISPDTPEF